MCSILRGIIISLNLKLFGDNMDLWHVSTLVCSLIGCALVENKFKCFMFF
jgi:hypothetical protein